MSSRLEIPKRVTKIEEKYGSILDAPEKAFFSIRKEVEASELTCLIKDYLVMSENGYSKLQAAGALKTTPPKLNENLKKAEDSGIIEHDNKKRRKKYQLIKSDNDVRALKV